MGNLSRMFSSGTGRSDAVGIKSVESGVLGRIGDAATAAGKSGSIEPAAGLHGYPDQADHNLTILWHHRNHTNFLTMILP